MVAEIERAGCVYQDVVVDLLRTEEAEQFIYSNRHGNPGLTADVLKAFDRLTADTVVWIKPAYYWRRRVDQDAPGRQQQG